MFYGFPSPFLHSSYSVQAESHIIADVAQSIQGQYEAIHYYSKLGTLAPDEQDREQILEIREDEIKHDYTFRQLYRSLTGKEPRVQRELFPNPFGRE
ncbi:ferritin-like domain-containing protein [Kroppenstedtia pulmonis]|uniref:ferritin-like domain-containing protein n=1 Tax=Kroppenstedtia pulmonis TaxID=1380685 RepID=UPI001FE8D168|nr:ferritin-like domain-containing protein [Kroppenstedtia pulmonis]